MKEKSSHGFRWTTDASALQHRLTLHQRDAKAEVTFMKAQERWLWRFELPAKYDNGPTPSSFAFSLAAAKAICEAIATGIGEDESAGKLNFKLQDVRWKAMGSMYLELRPRHGRPTAEVSFSDSTKQWAWYCRVPAGRDTEVAPTGLAGFKETAKSICEAIMAGTSNPQTAAKEKLVTLASFKKIPFKQGRAWRGPVERNAFERKINFRFPTDFLGAYGDWNGGSLDGYFVFDTAICKEMCGSTFFSMLDLEADEDQFSDSILRAVENCPLLKKHPLNEIPFIPFAKAGASRAAEERRNPYNVPSLLAFERKTKSVFLLSGNKNRKVFPGQIVGGICVHGGSRVRRLAAEIRATFTPGQAIARPGSKWAKDACPTTPPKAQNPPGFPPTISRVGLTPIARRGLPGEESLGNDSFQMKMIYFSRFRNQLSILLIWGYRENEMRKIANLCDYRRLPTSGISSFEVH